MWQNEEDVSNENDYDDNESGSICQGGYSFEFGEPAVEEVLLIHLLNY